MSWLVALLPLWLLCGGALIVLLAQALWPKQPRLLTGLALLAAAAGTGS